MGKDLNGETVCYDSAKVKLDAEVKLVKLNTRKFTDSAERVPCTDTVPILFKKSVHDSWLSADNNGIKNRGKPVSFSNLYAKVK